jgi:two-component system, chemotaxis family, sensor kinase Cph1
VDLRDPDVSVILGSGDTLAEAKEALEARLLALAHAHKMLGEAAWRGAPLGEIIKSELSAFEKNLSVRGCDLFVNTIAAQQFALIVYELATNAAKYGALSSPGGKVVIEGRGEQVNGDKMFAKSAAPYWLTARRSLERTRSSASTKRG